MVAKLSISVTDKHAKLIEDAVDSGEYASASEVVRAALRSWSQADYFDQAIEEGIASGFGEPDRPIEEIIAKARKSLKAKRRA